MSATYDVASAVAGTLLAVSGGFAFVGFRTDATQLQTKLMQKAANKGEPITPEAADQQATKILNRQKGICVVAWVLALICLALAIGVALDELLKSEGDGGGPSPTVVTGTVTSTVMGTVTVSLVGTPSVTVTVTVPPVLTPGQKN